MNKLDAGELTDFQKKLCAIVSGGVLVLCGIFLLLVSVEIIGLQIRDIVLPVILFAVGLSLLITAFIQRNTVSMWLSFVFIVPGITVLLCTYSGAGYKELYPLFIVVPAVASFASALLGREWKFHLKIIGFFGLMTVLFFMQSFGVMSWQVLVPVLIIVFGAGIIVWSLLTKNKTEETV